MNTFPIKAMFDLVYVVKDEAPTNEAGFYLPDSVKNRAQTGVVVAVGPGYLNQVTAAFIPTTVKVGDRVFIKQGGGYEITYKEWKVVVFNEKDIIGILPEGE